MKLRNVIVYLIIFVCAVLNVGNDFDEYENLKNRNVPLIRKEDLPMEFSQNAYDVIVDFIQKTRFLNYEWVIFFDYVGGDILKCAKGICNEVRLDFDECEFDGYLVASLHNHPKEVLFPPSGKNFGILTRNFEDYELIAGFEYFWILKAKGQHVHLIEEMNNASDTAFMSSFLHCISRYNDEEVFNRMHDLRYGAYYQSI